MVLTRPVSVVSQISVRPGMTIADFGSGSGHYTEALAPLVGVSGRVYAFDIQRALVDRLQAEFTTGPWSRVVTPLWADLEREHGSGLAAGQVDLVIVSNVLFQTKRPRAVIKEARRILKPGGLLLVVDWRDSCSGIGPHPDHVIPEEQVADWSKEFGFAVMDTLDVGRCHYGLLLQLRQE